MITSRGTIETIFYYGIPVGKLLYISEFRNAFFFKYLHKIVGHIGC